MTTNRRPCSSLLGTSWSNCALLSTLFCWLPVTASPLPPQVYVDNPFPIPLIQHTCSVRCLDMSASRNKLALVDETSSVVVYDLTTKVGQRKGGVGVGKVTGKEVTVGEDV